MHKLLVANRGEIARRLFRACHDLGIDAVAVATGADGDAAWIGDADEVQLLDGDSAAETFLDTEKILAAARAAGADAIHPGYGYLAENAGFAAACADAGIVFVGPPPGVMRRLGSKVAAKEIAAKSGVPTIPGVDCGGKTDAEVQGAVDDLGYPVLVKASAGGGGRGMRIVTGAGDLAAAVAAARAEAASAFGDDRLLVERYFPWARHVEVQILGDGHGHIVHLGERECSIQRRHQKIIEEAPAPGISPGARQRIAAAALALAREAQYESAGTVEFLVDPEDDFFFLEVNTRLQVEHPVTEAITGVDLAAWQIRVARGEALTLDQGTTPSCGHAVEARIYAEDPAAGFLPSSGRLQHYRAPAGPGIRCDDALIAGDQVAAQFDPMIAKVVAHGTDRPQALQRLARALAETVVLGVTTNLAFLQDIVTHPEFQAGATHTRFLEEHMAGWMAPGPARDDEWLAAAAYEALRRAPLSAAHGPGAAPQGPWAVADAWRNVR
ncbi:MAG: acetyl/propionyl/methylcrotonyl-CoA carboxylase subunit alpha [Anaerolineae bacterium]